MAATPPRRVIAHWGGVKKPSSMEELLQSLLALDLNQLLAKYTGQSFSMVPNRVLEATFGQRIPSMAAVLYMWMCSTANEDGVLWWSVNKIAEKFQVRPRTISRWCANLISEDLISRTRRLGRSTITTVLGHPKLVNKMARKNPKITQDSGKPAKTLIHDPQCHDVHDPQDHVESDPLESDPHFEPSPHNQDLDPRQTEVENLTCKRQENDDDDLGDLGRLWELAERAGLPDFFGYGPTFRKSPETLAVILELSDEALLWAFWQIEHGPDELKPRTAAYWLRRLPEQAALYRPVVPPSPPVEQFEDVPVEDPVVVEPPLLGDVPEWGKVCERIREIVPATTFSRWFEKITPGYDGDTLCFWLADEFDQVFVEKNFSDLLRILCGEAGLTDDIRYIHPGNQPDVEEFQVEQLGDEEVAVSLETLFRAGIRRNDPEYMRKFGEAKGDSDFERAVAVELEGGLAQLEDLVDRGVLKTVLSKDEQKH